MEKLKTFAKQPKYFDSFKCIGGKCPESCCENWKIVWQQHEIDKLRSRNCSDKLKELIDSSFIPDNNSYRIQLDENRKCPFLTEEKLCLIQKELGEEYLSFVCSDYPREAISTKNICTRVCSSSCYAVLDILIHDENCMEKMLRALTKKVYITSDISKADQEDHPELFYLNEIFDFLYDILFDKSRNIEDSIILGALAAKKLSDFAEDGKTDMLLEVIKKLKPQLENPQQLESIKNIKPNYIFSIGVINDILQKMYGSKVLEPLYTDGKADVDKFLIGMSKFNKAFCNNSYAVRNLILNYFFEYFSAFYNKEYSIYDNYLYFTVCAAAVKLVCASVGYVSNTEEQAQEEFLRCQAIISRKFNSSKSMIHHITDDLKSHNWHTIGYLASMIK